MLDRTVLSLRQLKNSFLPLIILSIICFLCQPIQLPKVVPAEVMEQVYDEVKTPHKYGLVLTPEDQSKKIDCPTVFRKDGKWYMTYFIYDGRGYGTWLASSDNLLDWTELGKVMDFSDDSTAWDQNQKAGYPSLQDPKWGGSYELQTFDNK